MLPRLAARVGGFGFSHRELRLLLGAVFLSFLGTSIAFPLRLLYASAHGATPTELGLMASAFLFAPLLAQLPLGWLVDTWGRVPVLLVSLASHTLISGLYIILNSPPELIALRFLEGVTTAGFRPAVAAYIADVSPDEHRSEAFGALIATLNAAMLIGPALGGVIGQSLGFGYAFGLSMVVEALAVFLVVGRVAEPARRASVDEGGEAASVSQLFSLPLVGAYCAFLGAQAAMGVLGSLWAIWIHDLGGSYTFIGMTFTMFALPQIFFGAFAGRLGDRWGRGRLLLLSGILAGATYMFYGAMTDLTLILLVGIAEGIVVVFQGPAIQALLTAASPLDARGRVQGIAGVVGAIGGTAASFASLQLYHHGRAIPFLLAGIAMMGGSIVAALGFAALSRQTALTEGQEAAA